MLKLSENPPVIWPPDRGVCDFKGLWWVAHTKSRNEKALAWQMQKRKISYFLPMTEKVYKKSRRVFRSMLPLFSGYVFFCGDEDDRLDVLRTNRIANLIKVENQERLLKELLQLEHAFQSGAALKPHKYIEIGQRCRVTAGPLRNIEGVAVKTKSGTRLILQIDMLGQAASVEVDTDIIEIIDEQERAK